MDENTFTQKRQAIQALRIEMDLVVPLAASLHVKVQMLEKQLSKMDKANFLEKLDLTEKELYALTTIMTDSCSNLREYVKVFCEEIEKVLVNFPQEEEKLDELYTLSLYMFHDVKGSYSSIATSSYILLEMWKEAYGTEHEPNSIHNKINDILEVAQKLYAINDEAVSLLEQDFHEDSK